MILQKFAEDPWFEILLIGLDYGTDKSKASFQSVPQKCLSAERWIFSHHFMHWLYHCLVTSVPFPTPVQLHNAETSNNGFLAIFTFAYEM